MPRSRTRAALTAATLVATFVVALLLAFVPWAAPAAALTGGQFDPSLIISDANFYDSNAMSQAQIQAFLDSKVSSCANGNCLTIKRTDTTTRVANAYCAQYDGQAGELTSAIIFKVQQACGISAKAILVTLQKEQSLVTATAPSDGRLERAMGYACPDTGTGCDPTYAGLYNQIYRAAWQFKRYGDPVFTWYPVGSASAVRYHPDAACGTGSVTIQNKATAALYYYTPYRPNDAALANLYGTGDSCSSYGNRNFWRDYNDWFGPPAGPPGSPDGELTVVPSTYGFVSIAGWAADSSDAGAAITIAVQVDATWYALPADEHLESLATDYPAYGADHGFTGSFAVSPGSHTVCVSAKNIGAGGDTSLGCRTATSPSRFTDVPVSHPFYAHVEWLATQGITNGYADGRFGVVDRVTRGQMAVFLYKMAGSPAYTAPAESRFPDVPVTHPFYKYVSWLVDQGISNGYGNGNFGVADAVTRGQMSVFLYKFAGSPVYTPPVSAQFPDVPLSHPFYKYVSWLVSKHISNGYGNGNFGGTDPVTRGQMAVFLYNYAHLP